MSYNYHSGYGYNRRPRRMMGDDAPLVIAAAGIAVVVGGLITWAALADDEEQAQAVDYCGTVPARAGEEPRVVDDQLCERATPGHDWYRQQFTGSDGSLVILGYGSPIVGPGYQRVAPGAPPVPSVRRAQASPSKVPTTISRGGLGVPAARAGGGSGGSSGS